MITNQYPKTCRLKLGVIVRPEFFQGRLQKPRIYAHTYMHKFGNRNSRLHHHGPRLAYRLPVYKLTE